ncbi:hypothetical protein AMTRI_Chr07g30280 [Amborella trichopoda]
MFLIPSFFGQRSNAYEPFSLDIWDPFDGLFSPPFNTDATSSYSLFNPSESATSAFLNANGVLTVTVPKVEAPKPDVKSIEISG